MGSGHATRRGAVAQARWLRRAGLTAPTLVRNVPAMDLKRAELLLGGIAAGEALGATAAGTTPAAMAALHARHRDRGWPFRPVGGGRFELAPGQAGAGTAMARCLLRATLLGGGRFDGAAFARELVGWLRSRPRQIGVTTSRAVHALADGAAWDAAGGAVRLAHGAPGDCGSLQRNGVVPALASDDDASLRLSVLHGLVTHPAPLHVLCCAAQTWLLRRLLAGGRPEPVAWLEEFLAAWTAWLPAEGDRSVARWRAAFAGELAAATADLQARDWHPDEFRPFDHPELQREGAAGFALQVAVWALHWSLRDRPWPDGRGLPPEVAARTGPFVLGWVAMLGGEGDACAAVAGPLLAAAHGGLPAELTAGPGPLF